MRFPSLWIDGERATHDDPLATQTCHYPALVTFWPMFVFHKRESSSFVE